MNRELIRQFYDKCEADIERDGQTIIGVDASPRYYYTVGNSRRGLADFIIVANLRPKSTTQLLNAVAVHQWQLGRPFLPGELIQPEDFTLPLKAHATPADILESHCCRQPQIEKGRTEPVTVLQLLLPDPRGKFPDEAGYGWDAGQIILHGRLN